jgi:hypothetical protein
LGVREEEIPSWFHNLSAAGAVTQDAANSTIAPITQVFSSCELKNFSDYIGENAFEDGFEVIKGSSPAGNKERIVDHTYKY